ncbi:unnamed protein product, partial [Rotaria sp. Silwood2]
ANEKLLESAKLQQIIFEILLNKLFNKSIEGLNETLHEVKDLQETHSWYNCNLIQIRGLKAKITEIQQQYDSIIRSILDEIVAQKEYAKEILTYALDQLETTIDTPEIKAHINQLMHQIDQLVDNMASQTLLLSIFSGIGMSSTIALIISLFVGASALGAFALGIGVIGSGIANQVIFRRKLCELDEKLRNNIKKVENKKHEQIKNLNEYFDDFEKKLRYYSTHSQTSVINIIWYDKKIQNDENQKYIKQLENEFSTEQYQILPYNNKEQTIELIKTNIQNNLILITSGSAGKEIISEKGYYFHIKGIIIFCSSVEYHRTWAKQYKKVLLITNQFSQVIQKIKDIECGEIYFLNFGFAYEDIALKLKNFNYYLSTTQNSFIIQNFSDINLNIDYHKNIMIKLHRSLKSKNIYSQRIPNHFQLENLMQYAEKFVEALKKSEPVKHIIHLYTAAAPYYYKIINDILNLLDEELILLIQDYIKALRYALLIYSDTSNRIPHTTNVKLYRDLCLAKANSFQEFLKKFNVNDKIVFPAFLSTSLNQNAARIFAGEKGVLLDISADCTKSNKPKSIGVDSQFTNEDEVLLNCFSLLTVKKITKIKDDLISYECKLELY